MRTYPRNSPQAAARIVALVLISDGHVCRLEERALEEHNIVGELGLAQAEFAQIVQTLCEDHAVAHATLERPVGHVAPTMLATLIDEVDDPALRRKVIRLCVAVAIADDYLADGEIGLLAAVLNAWGIAPTPVARPHSTPLRDHDRTAAST